MDISKLETGNVLIHRGNFCLSWKQEIEVYGVSIMPLQILGIDLRGEEKIYRAHELKDYILKKDKDNEE